MQRLRAQKQVEPYLPPEGKKVTSPSPVWCRALPGHAWDQKSSGLEFRNPEMILGVIPIW